jgi:hypothetical protein
MLAGPDALVAHRLDALGAFDDLPLPTTELEDWRYSRIDDLELDRFSALVPTGVAPKLPQAVAELVASLGDPAVLIVVSDGGDVSVTGEDPAVTVTELAAAELAGAGLAGAGLAGGHWVGSRAA